MSPRFIKHKGSLAGHQSVLPWVEHAAEFAHQSVQYPAAASLLATLEYKLPNSCRSSRKWQTAAASTSAEGYEDYEVKIVVYAWTTAYRSATPARKLIASSLKPSLCWKNCGCSEAQMEQGWMG